MISTLIILLLLHDAKSEMLARWPDHAAQIKQVAMPSIGYRDHARWELGGFALGHCDVTASPQIWVVSDRQAVVTIARLYHEILHFFIFAAGLPTSEHRRIDSS